MDGPGTAEELTEPGRGTNAGDRTTRVWETATGKEVHRFGEHQNHVFPLAFSPDSRLLMATSVGRTLHVRDVATGKLLRELQGHLDVIWSAGVSPDGRVSRRPRRRGNIF